MVRTRMLRLAALACTLLVGAIASADPQPHLQLGTHKAGVGGVGATFGDAEILPLKEIRLLQFDFRNGFPPRPTRAGPGEPKTVLDEAASKVTQTYPWGTLSCRYHADGDKILMDVELRNTTEKNTIFGLTVSPLQLRLPGHVTTRGWAHGWPSPSVLNDAPEIFDAAWPGGALAICNEQVDRPLFINLERVGHSDNYNVVFRHDGPMHGQEISAGDSRVWHLSIRFGPAGSNSITLANDIYQRYAQTYPSETEMG